MDDIALIEFLKTSPAFTGTVAVTEKQIIATFSSRDTSVDPDFVYELRKGERKWSLNGDSIIFERLPATPGNHFKPGSFRKVNLLQIFRAQIMNLRFKPFTR